MSCDIAVDQAPAPMFDDDEDIQLSERGSDGNEKVARHNFLSVQSKMESFFSTLKIERTTATTTGPATNPRPTCSITSKDFTIRVTGTRRWVT